MQTRRAAYPGADQGRRLRNTTLSPPERKASILSPAFARPIAEVLRTLLLVAIVVLGLGGPARAAAGPAPADEVFGPFKMTPLQIRLKLDMLGRAYHARWTSDHDILHDALLVDGALHAWATAYPEDTWLAPTAFHLAQLYAAVQTNAARAQATSTFRYVASRWPTTSFGHASKLRLSRGFPPLHAESPVRPTPNPYARAAPVRATPKAAPTGAPTSPAQAPTPGPNGARTPAARAPTPAPPTTPASQTPP